MSNEGVALLIMYVFVVFTVILPLALTPLDFLMGYINAVNVRILVSKYLEVMVGMILLLVSGAFLVYRYSSSLVRFVMRDMIRIYHSHGIFDIFINKKLIQLYLLLLIPAVITYLVSSGILRVTNSNYITPNNFPLINPVNLTLMIIGIVNLVLSTWLIISISYLQLRIATKRIISRLGSAIGSTVGIAASTGTAAFIGSACGLGVCTAPAFSVSPMAMIVMSVFDINVLELIHYSLIVLPLLTLITLVLLAVIHRNLVRSL